MKLAVTRDLHDYWDRLKGERAAPDRADIDPVAIRHILADTFIIEVDADRRFPLRLCGARINALWLGEQKGRLFLGWWSARHRCDIAEAIRQVSDKETPLVTHARAEPLSGAPAELELLLLPLRHFGSRRSRVLGSLAPVQPPAWLGLCPIGQLDPVATRTPSEQAPEASEGDWRFGSTMRSAQSDGESRSFP
ncbi:MAG: PAS domain-containing protein [Methylocystis sp.]|nr:PAS domain-containing protein [Methylocystis sp.]